MVNFELNMVQFHFYELSYNAREFIRGGSNLS